MRAAAITTARPAITTAIEAADRRHHNRGARSPFWEAGMSIFRTALLRVQPERHRSAAANRATVPVLTATVTE